MENWKNLDMLYMVEMYAADNKMISSEKELSDLFDAEVLPLIIEQYGENDQPAIDQAFNDWIDSLCQDHVIHDEQYRVYCYVGKAKGD